MEDRYGRLTLIEIVGLRMKKNGKREMWGRFKCDCGTIKECRMSDVKMKRIISCSCHKRQVISEISSTHRLTKHRLYGIWLGIKKRCYNEKEKSYPRYGGRGIRVCSKWENDFMSFYNWAINNGWGKGLVLDRINNDGNYEPVNCRFTTVTVNNNNKRNNLRVTINGETKTVGEFSKQYNIKYQTLRDRILKGYKPSEWIKPVSEFHWRLCER